MDFVGFLKTVAPWLGTALGGPLGGLAASKVAEVLGASEKTQDALSTAFSGAKPEDLLALKKADQEFEVQMKALGFKQHADLEQIAATDRASARDMQKSIRSWVPSALSIVITSGFLGLLAGMMTDILDVNDSQALLLMLGSLTTGFGGVLNYWFGSTSGSQTKTDIISRSGAVK